MIEQKENGVMRSRITRRDMIKAAGAGMVGLGLVYTRPSVDTIHAAPAFAGYDGAAKEGLTPGFWKQPHHADNWRTYKLTDDYGDTFGVKPSFKDRTLLGALKQGGGGEKALARHAVAALLNAEDPNINYFYTIEEIKALVQNAYTTGDFETAKNLLAAQNELEPAD